MRIGIDASSISGGGGFTHLNQFLINYLLLNKTLVDIKQRELDLAKELSSKYGEGSFVIPFVDNLVAFFFQMFLYFLFYPHSCVIISYYRRLYRKIQAICGNVSKHDAL